ncbi:MAG TPA: L-threonylcarbamoyladenylate synthase [Bacteroidota bacterium]|nr:L-threonylcarbamoyladenylate synthase [Bacteroidota bacterium]
MKPVTTIFTRSARTAARCILSDELAAFPTETVYGLGANVFSEQALKKIFEAKGRPADNPLIVHISRLDQIGLLTPRIPKSARKIIDTFFPGPITVIVPKRKEISKLVSAGLDTIGIRMPKHETAQEFLRECGVPVAAPSANLSGTPSPTSWMNVRDDLNGKIRCILKGRTTDVGLESTVVDCTGRRPLVLRTGAVTLEALQSVLPETRLYTKKKTRNSHEPAAVKSPGMKYRHYSPKAHVVIVSVKKPPRLVPGVAAAYIGLTPPKEHDATRFAHVLVCHSVDEYARRVFSFFRRCDKKHIQVICCEQVAPDGLGRALMDRITRAAHHD